MYQRQFFKNRRENLRFLGVQESMADKEDTREVIYQLLIARFLRFQDREFIFNKVRKLSGSLSIKVLVDLPKEIRDRRKAQWPKLKKARDEGKRGYFSRREPDKLYINGEFVPM